VDSAGAAALKRWGLFVDYGVASPLMRTMAGVLARIEVGTISARRRIAHARA
jgi:hypothetical protein